MERLHDDAARGGHGERDCAPATRANGHRVRAGLRRADRDARAGNEARAGEKPQDVRTLIGNSNEAHLVAGPKGPEGHAAGREHHALSIGDRVSVRIGARSAKHLVEAVDEAGRDGVLQAFGFFVHLRPVHANDADEEGLEDAVSADDIRRRAAAPRREPHSAVAAIRGQPLTGEASDHGGRRARCDSDDGGETADAGLPGAGLSAE